MPPTEEPHKLDVEYTEEFVYEELLNSCALLHWKILPPVGGGPVFYPFL